MARIAEKLSVDVEPITKAAVGGARRIRGLFIPRDQPRIDNHTYRFARRAWHEGMPVIDDPISMIRCTNKVFLMELLGSNQVATPPTVMLADASDMPRAMDELGLPLVVKIPDGCSRAACTRCTRRKESAASPTSCSEETDLLLAQKFLPTAIRLARGRARGRAAVRVPIRMAPATGRS